MTTTFLAMAIALSPLLGIVGLLWLAERIQLRRDARYARQIALTEAIHRELGAIVAPTVQRRRWGGWLVKMMVPLDRPATVAAILRVTHEMFGSGGRSRRAPYEIVLTCHPTSPRSEAMSAPRPAVEKPARVAA